MRILSNAYEKKKNLLHRQLGSSQIWKENSPQKALVNEKKNTKKIFH